MITLFSLMICPTQTAQLFRSGVKSTKAEKSSVIFSLSIDSMPGAIYSRCFQLRFIRGVEKGEHKRRRLFTPRNQICPRRDVFVNSSLKSLQFFFFCVFKDFSPTASYKVVVPKMMEVKAEELSKRDVNGITKLCFCFLLFFFFFLDSYLTWNVGARKQKHEKNQPGFVP